MTKNVNFEHFAFVGQREKPKNNIECTDIKFGAFVFVNLQGVQEFFFVNIMISTLANNVEISSTVET